MKLPIFRKLAVEDFEGQKDWIDKLLSPLNDFFTTVYTSLNKQLTFTQNMDADIKSFSFVGGQTVTLKNPLTHIPAGAVIIKLQYDNNQPDNITSNYSLYWYFDYPSNQIKILINGVTTDVRYKASILIIGA